MLPLGAYIAVRAAEFQYNRYGKTVNWADHIQVATQQ